MIHVGDSAPGISRRRAGKGFAYRGPDGSPVRDATTLQRIRALAIPPAYKALPTLRRRLRRDLALSGWPREKVLALVVAVMADTLVRVGNAGYARENKSFGLTTLRNRHAEFVSGGRARLHFRGKGGQEHDIALDCCESAFWVSETRVPLIAHQLQDVSVEDLQSAIDTLDYDSLYHGDYLQEHPQELADTFRQIATLYEKAGQSAQAVLFMIC